MVSLSRSFNTTSGGAIFFSESVNMEDRERLRPELESYKTFKPLNTIPAVSFHLLATLGLEITAIVLAVLHPDEKSKCFSFFLILYMHIALWFVTLIIDLIVRYKHHELRINGYLDFYKQTYNHHRLPFYTLSLWNTVILFIQTIMQHFYPDNFAEHCIGNHLLSPINSILAFITVEVCVIYGINISYIVKVHKFNKNRPLPDVQKEEWATCSSSEGIAQDEVGVPSRDKITDLIEKQADLIRYLKEHNNRLSEKVMTLNAQLQVVRSRA